MKLDLTFLRTCKHENLTPQFIKFNIQSKHSHHRQATKNCYKEILLNEIKCKKSELSRLYHLNRNFKSLIISDFSHLMVCRIEKIIRVLVVREQFVVKKRHVNEIEKLITKQRSSISNASNKSKISPIPNLSKRTLTNYEHNILENGLNYVLSNTKLDELKFISDIETYFINLIGYNTDKRDYQEKTIDEPITHNLISTQLNYVRKIRSVCNTFQLNTNKIIVKHKQQSMKMESLKKPLNRQNDT